MRRIKKDRVPFNPDDFKKGRLLIVKVPPFYDKEYLYEVSGAGASVVRANLYHSPKVKKQWSHDDLALLFDNGMIRFAQEADVQRLTSSSTEEIADTEDFADEGDF